MIADGFGADKHGKDETQSSRRKTRGHRGGNDGTGPSFRAHALSCGGLLLYGLKARSVTVILARISYDEAYPGIEILPRSRNWWAWLKGTPPECIHLGEECDWIATLLPDTLYLRGKRAQRRDPIRPEITLCRECLARAIGEELESFAGRVVAFEPDAELFTQYFFVAQPDFEAAGLRPEVAQAIAQRSNPGHTVCEECGQAARWLWFSREQVGGLDEVEKIAESPGEWLCAKHGARNLLAAFERIADANIFYMNLPYGEAGAYVWI
jgi:hypothetical protein